MVDTSVLSNFVDAGLGALLTEILGTPPLVGPSVIDPMIAPPHTTRPMAEFSLGLFLAQSRDHPRYRKRHAYRVAFISAEGQLWRALPTTQEDLTRARELQQQAPFLSLADAEGIALAQRSGVGFLCDDNDAVEVARKSGLQVWRTCGLLVEAVRRNLLSCPAARAAFNEVMGGEWGFFVRRRNPVQRLVLDCDPVRCSWVNE